MKGSAHNKYTHSTLFFKHPIQSPLKIAPMAAPLLLSSQADLPPADAWVPYLKAGYCQSRAILD